MVVQSGHVDRDTKRMSTNPIQYWCTYAHGYKRVLIQNGILLALEYLCLAISFYVTVERFFRIISTPASPTAAEFRDQKSSLKTMAIFFTITYAFRAVAFSMFGHYDLIFSPQGKPHSWLKFFFFLLFSTVLEAPHMFYLYVNHYRSF